jgi:hypothetical protein
MPFFISNKKLQAMTASIQANIEGKTQSILNITYEELIKKVFSNWTNQYITYEQQQQKIYQGYQCKCDFGTSYIADVLDKRTNLIISEGLSITANKAGTQKFINEFIDCNKLDGSKLIELVLISEMEGRILNLIYPKVEKEGTEIKVKNIRFRKTKYKLIPDTNNTEDIETVIINDSTGNPISYNDDQFVYSYSGISFEDDPIPCIASILTNCEYADRALYDIRRSNHIFGHPTPNIETQDINQQKKIKNDIDQHEWKIGDVLIGSKLSYPQPPNSTELLKGEISLHLKIISSRTGIPVHWLGWTDLMSNRATALELRDFISTCIKDEKIRIREHVRELICKSMKMAVDNGVENAMYDEDFEVDVPDVSIETVKALSETWQPLYEADIISKFDIQNKIPGINPLKTNRQIEKEKKENMDRFTSGITQGQYPNHQDQNMDENNTDENNTDESMQNKEGSRGKSRI